MMAKTVAKRIGLLIAVAIFTTLLVTDADAKTNFARKKEQPAIEETAKPVPEPYSAPCQDPPPCCPSQKKSLGQKIGASINRFLAFGCRTNHALTSWIISDKCDPLGKPACCP